MNLKNKDLLDVMMEAISHSLSNVHTATIAKITSVGAATINCRPVTSRIVDGKGIDLPEFVDVPMLVLQGGGSYTAYPVAIGDYALLIFTERCFDRWWSGQDFQPPPELRMHDYSDGIAIVGLNPMSGAIAIPATIKQLGDAEQVGNYTHSGNMTRTGDTNLTGNATATGFINAASFKAGGTAGVSGSFTTMDGKNITVTNGIVTGIV